MTNDDAITYYVYAGTVYCTDDPNVLWGWFSGDEWISTGCPEFWNQTECEVWTDDAEEITREQAAEIVGCEPSDLE